jgi:hypothetical protein
MKSSHQLTIFLLLILTGIHCQVKFVFELIRNGASSPNILDSNNFDMFGEKWLRPQQLTVTGMKNQFVLGQKLRRHYIDRVDFLPATFDADLFKLFTLDEASWLSSAYVHMLGLYPGGGATLKPSELQNSMGNYDLHNMEEVYKELKLSALPHQAEVFPIVSFPPENNYFGLTNPETCKGVVSLEKQNLKKNEVKNILKNFTDKYFNPLEKPLNLTQNFFLNFTNTKNFCNQFLAGYTDKREMKKIKQLNATALIDFDEIAEDCRYFGLIEVYTVRLGDKSKDVVKIASTNLIKQLIHYMDEVIKNEILDRPLEKFVLYTGDKFDVGSFLDFLRMSLGTEVYFPKFSSSLMIELSKSRVALNNSTKEEDFKINIFFNDKTLTSIVYATFKRKLLQNTVDSDTIEDFCGFKEDNTLVFKLAAAFLFCASLGIGLWIYLLFKKMKKYDTGSKPDPEAGEQEDGLNKKLITEEVK